MILFDNIAKGQVKVKCFFEVEVYFDIMAFVFLLFCAFFTLQVTYNNTLSIRYKTTDSRGKNIGVNIVNIDVLRVIKWIGLELSVEVSSDAVKIDLPENFVSALASVAVAVANDDSRVVLSGINLSNNGITATVGKQLINVPLNLEITENITIPFPLAFLSTNYNNSGKMHVWQEKGNRIFKIEIGNFTWISKAILGIYPDWKSVIPST